MNLLSVDDAIHRILAGVEPLPAERVAVSDADGRVLAEPVVAVRTHPPAAVSAMDGYAVRARDLAAVGGTAQVVGTSAAGHGFTGRINQGEAVRIFTGAPIPDGADAVVIQEDVDADGDRITTREAARAGRHVRPAGLDFSAGTAVLPAGRRLGFRELALAAAAGDGFLTVRRRPRIAILATGDELVPPGMAPGRDQIVASNGLGVATLARASGATPIDLGIARDSLAAIEAAADRALADEADVLVTLGGASVGDHDLVQKALTARGMALGFWKIAMRPGKPLMFGRLGGLRVLGLPGNPVSALVCASLFLRPLIAALLGMPACDPTEPARLGSDLPANDARRDYLRAKLEPSVDGLPVATSFPAQDSSMLSVFALSSCLIIREPNAPPAISGDACRIIRLD